MVQLFELFATKGAKMHSWPNLKHLLSEFCSFLDKQLLSCQVGAVILAHTIKMA